MSWLVRSSLGTNRDFQFLNERIFWFLNRRKVTQSDACLEHVQFFLRRAQAERFNFCWFFGLPCTPRTTSELFNLLKLWQFSSRLILFEHSCFLPLKFNDLFDYHNLSLSFTISRFSFIEYVYRIHVFVLLWSGSNATNVAYLMTLSFWIHFFKPRRTIL